MRNNLSKEAVGQYVSSDYKKELYLQDNNNWQIMSNGNILEEGVWEFNLSEDGYYIEIFKDSCVHFNNYNQYWNYYDSLIIYKNIKGNSTRFSR